MIWAAAWSHVNILVCRRSGSAPCGRAGHASCCQPHSSTDIDMATGELASNLTGELVPPSPAHSHCDSGCDMGMGELALTTTWPSSVDDFWHGYRLRKTHPLFGGWPLGIRPCSSKCMGNMKSTFFSFFGEDIEKEGGHGKTGK